MLLGYLALIIGIVLSIVCVILATAVTPIAVTVFSTAITIPPAAAVGISWIAGAGCLLGYRQMTQPKTKSDKILQTWDKQDSKLELEILNDKVSQLEAKNQTLETALQSALKKKKA